MQLPHFPIPIDRLAEIDQAECEYEIDTVEIQGIVSEGGQGGSSGKKDYKTQSYTFAAWREVGGSIVNRSLYVMHPIPKDAEYSWLPKYSIQRLMVLLSRDRTRAVAVEPSAGTVSDPELSAIGEELQKPVVISTHRFGDLRLDRKINWFEGKAKWNGELIGITFDSPNSEYLQKLLATAEKLWEHQAEWKRRVEDYAVQELLPLKNDSWLDDDEQPLSVDQFKAKMSLQSVMISEEGQFTFWHDDGDLFFGHTIEVSGSLEQGPTDAGIPG